MMTKAAAKKHATAMEAQVRRWRSSGKSQAEFCRETGIKPHVLSYWYAKHKAQKQAAAPAVAKRPTFFEVINSEGEQQRDGHAVEVTLPTGVTLRVYGRIDAQEIGALVDRLATGQQ